MSKELEASPLMSAPVSPMPGETTRSAIAPLRRWPRSVTPKMLAGIEVIAASVPALRISSS